MFKGLRAAALGASLVVAAPAVADEKTDLTATDDLNILASDTCNMGVVGAGVDQRYDEVFVGLPEDERAYLLAGFENAKADMKTVLDCSEADGRFYGLVRDLMHGEFAPDERRAMFDKVVEIVKDEKASELGLFKLPERVLDVVDTLSLEALMDHEGHVDPEVLKKDIRDYAQGLYQEYSFSAMCQEMANFFEIPDTGSGDISHENGYALMADVREEIGRYLTEGVRRQAGIENGDQIVPTALTVD